MTTEEIKAHYLTGFSSSPAEVSDNEITIIIESKCQCTNCGKGLIEMYDFPEFHDNTLYCEDCFREKYYQTCPICEDYYEKPEKPEDHILIISKETVEEYGFGVKPGFHQVLSYPFFRACTVFGFDGLYEDAIQLIHECDINGMMKKLFPLGSKDRIIADDCCHDCMMKYSGKTKIKNNYINKHEGKKRVALLNKVIKEGK